VTHAISHIVRFKREILPGEKLEIETKVLSWKRGLCKVLVKELFLEKLPVKQK
jgi:3-hydroxymyristoyl/3-hydroxydecanoyl-(acyl carrier protein) dehydratase